jgi:hypothetical protein
MSGATGGSAALNMKEVLTGTGPTPFHYAVRAMITSQGFGLIAELIAAALLIAALTGFVIWRSQPWLVGVTAAFVILIVAVTIIINSSV